MAELFDIHPQNPQVRLVRAVVDIIRGGGLVIYPTDSCYAIGCQIGNKRAVERMRRIRGTGKRHYFTLVCSDLSEIATYARVSNSAYRLLKAYTPGPYTFVLKATSTVPKRLQEGSRRTIGIRVPDHPIPQLMLSILGEPIMSSTLSLPGDEHPLSDPYEIRERLDRHVDAIIDAGGCGLEPSTVVDLVDEVPTVIRRGKGDVSAFE